MNRAGRRSWRRNSVPRVLIVAVLMGPFAGLGSPPVRGDIPQMGCYKRDGLEPKIEAAIEEFRASVPALMVKGDVPGAALALVDDQGIVWVEGFGHLDGKKTEPVTPDTPFMICGMSKLITATAAMLAVQEGLVKLDEPLTTYLPDFQMNSRYEEHPQRKITLRLLLSFTAGLPMAMPLGNSFEPASSAPFEEHVKSLYGSWMVCPVGRSFCYSDASSDLAAYVIRTVAGKPFKDYLQERLFGPLGMSNTTADRPAILNNPQRAIGHIMGIAKLPAVYPALGSDGIYSSARDMARFVQLYINHGMLDGHAFVQRSLIDAVCTPIGIAKTDPNQYYGQGTFIGKRLPEKTETGSGSQSRSIAIGDPSPTRNIALGAPTVLWHDGLGFGFMSLMYWYPEYGIGMVVLTNRLPNPVFDDLGVGLTDKLVKGRLVEKRFPRPEPDYSGCLGAWRGWPEHQPTPYKSEWRQYCGTHNLKFSEYALEWWAHVAVLIVGRDEYTPRIHVCEKGGFLCVTESKFFEQVGGVRVVDEKLQEVRPGVFMTKGGGTLDFTREIPTWCNYRLEER